MWLIHSHKGEIGMYCESKYSAYRAKKSTDIHVYMYSWYETPGPVNQSGERPLSRWESRGMSLKARPNFLHQYILVP